MTRYSQQDAGEDGWSVWFVPIMTGYKLACCDCGLVHDVDLQVFRAHGMSDDGMTWEAREPVKDPTYRVRWRFRRNNRSTAAIRRHTRDKK